MNFRFMLDRDHVEECRKGARELARHLHRYIDRHTTEAVERATLRALGVHGEVQGRPLTEWAVEKIGRDRLREGAAYWLGAVMVERQCDAQAAAQHLARHGLPTERPARLPHAEIRKVTKAAAVGYQQAIETAAGDRRTRSAARRRSEMGSYAVVRSHDAATDLRHLHALATPAEAKRWHGAVVHPPLAAHEPTLVGKGRGWRGRYAVLDQLTKVGQWLQKREAGADAAPFHVTWHAHHLMAPEIVTLAATTPVQAVAYDAVSAARLGGIHFKRAIVDQQFLFRLAARSGLDLMVASDLWTADLDGYTAGYELLLGQLLIEAMATLVGIDYSALWFRTGFVLRDGAAARPDWLGLECAHAQLVRELFPQMPILARLAVPLPTEAATVAAVAASCGYSGWLLDAIDHQKNAPATADQAADRLTAIWSPCAALADDLAFVPNGNVHRRAATILDRLVKTIQQLQRRDLLQAIETDSGHGLFSMAAAGHGLDGVLQKHKYYWNPIEEWLMKKTPREATEPRDRAAGE